METPKNYLAVIWGLLSHFGTARPQKPFVRTASGNFFAVAAVPFWDMRTAGNTKTPDWPVFSRFGALSHFGT